VFREFQNFKLKEVIQKLSTLRMELQVQEFNLQSVTLSLSEPIQIFVLFEKFCFIRISRSWETFTH
jgi:hypothetical protein